MTPKHRVVFVSQRFPPDKGGNAARIHDIATHLDGEEWAVTVLAPPPSYPPGEFDRSYERTEVDRIDGVDVHRLWTWQPQTENPGMARRLAYYLLFGIHTMLWLLYNAKDYDFVLTTTPPISTGAPGLLAAGLGKPWVVDVRDLWIDASISLGYLGKGSLIERVSRRFQRFVLHTADRIMVTTELLGESLQDTYGESLGGKILLVPNGVDVDRFQPPPDREKWAEPGVGRVAESDTVSSGAPGSETGVVTEPYSGRSGQTIIYTGNLGSAQDLKSCIRAMSRLSTENVTLRLVGSGDMETELRELVDALDVGDQVEFAGVVPREEVPGLLREATIGIAPLRDTANLAYAMPTKVYEYMASGLPTVVTGRGEIKQFIEQSGGGVHVANDPAQIAEQLDELLADEVFRERLARNGREYSKQYDRKEITRRLGEHLKQLAVDRDDG